MNGYREKTEKPRIKDQVSHLARKGRKEKPAKRVVEARAVARVPIGNWPHSLPATTPLADAAAGTPEVVFLPFLAQFDFQRALFIHEPTARER